MKERNLGPTRPTRVPTYQQVLQAESEIRSSLKHISQANATNIIRDLLSFGIVNPDTKYNTPRHRNKALKVFKQYEKLISSAKILYGG